MRIHKYANAVGGAQLWDRSPAGGEGGGGVSGCPETPHGRRIFFLYIPVTGIIIIYVDYDGRVTGLALLHTKYNIPLDLGAGQHPRRMTMQLEHAELHTRKSFFASVFIILLLERVCKMRACRA